MKSLKTSIALAVAFLAALSARSATPLPVYSNETLHYVVQYKWGMIQKDTGDATLSIKEKGDKYYITLTGKTRPWADKIYRVRDTLYSQLSKSGFSPVSYTRIAHEKNNHARDYLTYTVSGNSVKAHCDKIRTKKGTTKTSEQTLTATGATFDMASIFYYVRTLDYAAMSPGKTVSVNMFSGSKKELLTITYRGRQKVTLRNKQTRDSYYITFYFTSDGKKESSSEIKAWLSTDATHVPYVIEGSLPIGKVKAFLQT